tara:strand:+ start:181 stop:591 length:411 start_codon:yes stop_codon:yes gene_type:complete
LNLRQQLLKRLAVPAVLATFGLFGVASYAQQPKPATIADINLYQAMGTSFFCLSVLEGMEFPKSLGISTSTYVQALKGRHQGKVASLKGKTLTDKEMFAAAETQILLRAMSGCPKAIPNDVQAKIKELIKKQSGKS